MLKTGKSVEIDVEKRNILPNLARIGDSFSREEIYQIIADLVPPNKKRSYVKTAFLRKYHRDPDNHGLSRTHTRT